MSFAQAKQLARKAGLIPSEEEEYEELVEQGEHLTEWFATEGLHDPRKPRAAGGHPLEGDYKRAAKQEEREFDLFTERYQRHMAYSSKVKRFWRDYELVYDPNNDSILLEDAEQWVNGVNVNAPGYFRWQYGSEPPKSSLDFASNPIRTKRQIAGFVMGIVGRGHSLGIVQTGIVRNRGVETPYYTVFISKSIPRTKLMVENAYAVALRIVDLNHLEEFSEKVAATEAQLAEAQKNARTLKAESLDEDIVKAAQEQAARLLVQTRKLRADYSERIGKAYQQAEQAPEPHITLVTEGVEQTPVEIDTSRDEEDKELDHEFLESEEAIIQSALSPCRTGYARDIEF